MRHMILKPKLISDMRAEEMRGHMAAAQADSYPYHRWKRREELFDKAQAHYDKAAELARMAGVPEKTMVVGKEA